MKRALTAAALGFAVALVPVAPAAADEIRDGEWHLQYLKVTEANQRSTGEGVTVAIVDLGVDASHPDLIGSVLPPVAVDGNTDAARFDPDGHGTALAGLITAQGDGTNHDSGVVGVAPGARILPVVIHSAASPTPLGARTVEPDDLAAGIELATQHGARVIVVGYSVGASDRLRRAVEAAEKADAIVVAADGNRPDEAFEPFPASYDGVLAAVPLSHSGDVLVPSSSGRRLGFGVPGEQIMTTNAGGGYRIDDGSAAAGLLGGVVALVRSAYPKLPADEIVNRLSVTAVDAGARGPDAAFGQGRVDLVPALKRVVPALHPPTPSPAPTSAASDVTASPQVVAAPGTPGPRTPLGWLVALPLVVVLGILIGYAVRGERRIKVSRPDGIDSGRASS